MIRLRHQAAAFAADPRSPLAMSQHVRTRARREAAHRRILGALAMAAALACSTSAAVAQGPADAAIRGHITAVCGPYPHLCKATSVMVRVTSLDLRLSRNIAADSEGNFLVLRLPPGEYELRATSQLADHETAATRVDIDGGDLAEVMLTLGAPGAAVKPAASLAPASFDLQPQFATVQGETRDWEDLLQLDSEANAVPSSTQATDTRNDDQNDPASETSSQDGAASTGFSFAGLPATQGALSIDGLSGEQNFRSGPRGSATGGANSGASYNQGSVHTFHVLPHHFSAQFGTAGGVAIVSRAAGDSLHGDAFFRARESAWAATNPFSIETHFDDGVVTSEAVKPHGSLLQFGGSVGAPLLARKSRSVDNRLRHPIDAREPLAIFASLEMQWHNDDIVSTPALANFFSLSPEQTALLASRGVGSEATNAALNYLDSLTGTTTRHAYRLMGSLRLDAAPTGRDRMTLNYAGNRFDSPAGAALGQASSAVVARGRGSLGDSFVHVDLGSGRWLHLFSSRLNNEVRAQLAYDLEYETPRAPLAQEPAIGPGGYAPQVSIAPNGFAYGTPTSLAPGAQGGRSAYPDETRFELADTAQWHIGRHLWMLGGDWSRIHDTIDSLSAEEGAFSYDSGVTNGKDGGLVDWVTDYTFNVHAYPNGGCPSIRASVHYFCFRSFTQSFGPVATQFITHTVAGFVEDSMRLRNDLQITVGLRYDYTLLPLPQLPNPVLDAEIAALHQPIQGATSIFPEDRNNLGPRLAIAWSPRNVWGVPARWSRKDGALFTAHLGYGVFYGRIPGATVRAALTDTALNTTTTHVRIRPTTITDCPQVTTVQQGFGYPCDYDAAPPAAVAQTTSATVFASKYRLPAIQRATLSVEREIGARTSLRASYEIATATQLPGSTDLNISPSVGDVSYVLQGGDGHPGLHSGQAFQVPLYGARPISAYGAVTALVSTADATYNAFTAEARIRGLQVKPLRTLELRASYTFSRSIDYAPQSSATPGLDDQFDPFHNGYDKGLSNQQIPHKFAGSLEYETKMTMENRVVSHVLDRWRIAAIATAGSGAPYSYEIFGGTYLAGGRETINGSGGATYLPTIGRNTLRLPMREHLDLRLGKQLHTGPHFNVDAFAEAFNLLNGQNLSSVETRAFLLGTNATISGPGATGLPTPLVFQDAAALAAEGLTTSQPFGTPTSSTTGVSREREIELGLKLQF